VWRPPRRLSILKILGTEGKRGEESACEVCGLRWSETAHVPFRLLNTIAHHLTMGASAQGAGVLLRAAGAQGLAPLRFNHYPPNRKCHAELTLLPQAQPVDQQQAVEQQPLAAADYEVGGLGRTTRRWPWSHNNWLVLTCTACLCACQHNGGVVCRYLGTLVVTDGVAYVERSAFSLISGIGMP
jgi:hypothetical protein